MTNNIAIIGAGGTIGQALIKRLAHRHPQAEIHAFARQKPDIQGANVIPHVMDYGDEEAASSAAAVACKNAPLDMVLVATGILHDGADVQPEKSLRDLSADKFQQLFAVNTILPAMMAKHFIPRLRQDDRAVFAAISARIGSISDNRIGGWYAYRASKAALNMIIKNTAIEVARRHKNMIIAGLHPGTVDSPLSKPFQANIPEGQLFTPEFSAEKLLSVIDGLTPEDSGKCFAWDGAEIQP